MFLDKRDYNQHSWSTITNCSQKSTNAGSTFTSKNSKVTDTHYCYVTEKFSACHVLILPASVLPHGNMKVCHYSNMQTSFIFLPMLNRTLTPFHTLLTIPSNVLLSYYPTHFKYLNYLFDILTPYYFNNKITGKGFLPYIFSMLKHKTARLSLLLKI